MNVFEEVTAVENERLTRAIDAIKEMDPTYWTNTIRQRIPGEGSAGSVIDPWWEDKAEEEIYTEVEKRLKEITWYPARHEDVQEGVDLYVSSGITGRMGVVNLSSLPQDATVTLDDRKNTGKVSCVVKGVRGDKVDFVSLLVGQENGREVAFTFHPGWPVRASQVVCQEGMHGKEVTVKEALEMGLAIAKIV